MPIFYLDFEKEALTFIPTHQTYFNYQVIVSGREIKQFYLHPEDGHLVITR